MKATTASDTGSGAAAVALAERGLHVDGVTDGVARRVEPRHDEHDQKADDRRDIHPDVICLSHLDTTRDCQGRYSLISCPDV